MEPLARHTGAVLRHVRRNRTRPTLSFRDSNPVPRPARRFHTGNTAACSASPNLSYTSSTTTTTTTTSNSRSSAHNAEARSRSSSSPSVNASEISHFNALASTWWDARGPSRVLHLMNPLRHDFIRACHASQPSGPPPPDTKLRYLDVGCGGGIFAESAARLPTTASVTAVDPSSEIISVARRHAAQDPLLSSERLKYLNATIETLAQHEKEGGFDVVTLFEVVEHVDNPSAFLEACGRFVKPGGWLVLSTIARTWTSWFTTNLVAEDILGMVPKGTHDWTKYINEDELREYFAKKDGWSSPRVVGVVYVPGLGWKEVGGSEKIGNYFFAVRRDLQ